MQMLSIQKEFDVFKRKFKPFEPNSKHSNANSNNSKEIWSIQMQNLTIQKGFYAFECKFEPFEYKF